MKPESKKSSTSSGLTDLLSQVKSKQSIIEIAQSCRDNGRPFLQLSLHEDPNIAAKASWA